MAVASNEDGKKWIQTTIALVCILLGYVLISFFGKMEEWFQLESKVPFYEGITTFLSVVASFAAYITVFKNQTSSEFLTNVYQEVLKVVWPDSQQTWRHTFVIMVAVVIMGFVFGFFDFGANFLLSLVHK
jgi:preprotein translocase subunit SecE